MAFSKPFSEDEIEYIRLKHGVLSSAEIAEKLDRSQRGVNNKIKELGLSDANLASCARVKEGLPEPPGIVPGGRLEALFELRDMIRAEVILAEGQTKAKLSQEYREILSEIDALENPVGGDQDDEGIGDILCTIGLRTSS